MLLGWIAYGIQTFFFLKKLLTEAFYKEGKNPIFKPLFQRRNIH